MGGVVGGDKLFVHYYKEINLLEIRTVTRYHITVHEKCVTLALDNPTRIDMP